MATMIQSRATHAKQLWNRYFFTIFTLLMGIFFAYWPNHLVTSPELVLSAPQSFVSTPFEFRYVDLTKTQVLSTDNQKTVVMFDMSIQGQPFRAYGAVSPSLLKELNRTQQLLLVKGNYEKETDGYVLNEVTVSYGWMDTVYAVFYQATKLVFNHRLAVMTASFSLWFIASVIWTLFKMKISEEIGEIADIGKDLLE